MSFYTNVFKKILLVMLLFVILFPVISYAKIIRPIVPGPIYVPDLNEDPLPYSSCSQSSTSSIKVLSPNGGEIYHVGDTLNIVWSVCNYPFSNIGIFLLDPTMVSQGFPLGTGGTMITAVTPVSNGSYQFVIPAAFATNPPHVLGGRNIYRISLGEGFQGMGGVWDESDGAFSILR